MLVNFKIINAVLIGVLGYLIIQCIQKDKLKLPFDITKESKKIPLPFEGAGERTLNNEEEEEEEEEEEKERAKKIEAGILESQPAEIGEVGAPLNISGGCNEDKIPFLSSHLLPQKEEGDEDFSEFAPKQSDITNQNFLNSDRFTVASESKRNSNLSIRSEPPNPKVMVCPWMQSTIEPDQFRKPLEIGV